MRGQGLQYGGQLTGAQRRTRRSEVIGVLQLGQDGGRDSCLELILAQAVENEGRHPLTVQPGSQGRVQPVGRQPLPKTSSLVVITRDQSGGDNDRQPAIPFVVVSDQFDSVVVISRSSYRRLSKV